MKKILAAFLCTVLLCNATFAQTGAKSLTISFIANDFTTAQRLRSSSLSTVLRDKQVARIKDMNLGLGITYANGVSEHTDLAVTVGGSFGNVALPNKSTSGDNFLLEADASGHFKMIGGSPVFTPYLIAGIGASKYTNVLGAFIPLGGGFKFNFSNEAQVHLQLQYRVPVTTEANLHHFQISFGIGGLVNELKKATPPPPPPPPPADTDGDGINDPEDACPTVFGLARYKGCPVPDTDKDGINDEADKCPTVPGTAKYNGCPVPDTDKDGINDEEDKCPNEAGVARYQGCPVPDSDKDGVSDEDDRCPQVAGTAANKGCPEVTPEMIKKMEYAAKRIFFITGSAKLSPKSNSALDEVVKVLSDDTNVKLSIEGHTDNVGKADYNKTLSDKRAAAVKDYLVKKGVDESRLTSEGFGMEKPVAPNKTAAGRTQNRRVELKLAY